MVLFGIFAKRIFESMRTSWSYVINFYDYHTVFSQFSLQIRNTGNLLKNNDSWRRLCWKSAGDKPGKRTATDWSRSQAWSFWNTGGN